MKKPGNCRNVQVKVSSYLQTHPTQVNRPKNQIQTKINSTVCYKSSLHRHVVSMLSMKATRCGAGLHKPDLLADSVPLCVGAPNNPTFNLIRRKRWADRYIL